MSECQCQFFLKQVFFSVDEDDLCYPLAQVQEEFVGKVQIGSYPHDGTRSLLSPCCKHMYMYVHASMVDYCSWCASILAYRTILIMKVSVFVYSQIYEVLCKIFKKEKCRKLCESLRLHNSIFGNVLLANAVHKILYSFLRNH